MQDIESGIEFVCDRLDLPFEPREIPRLKSGFRDLTITLDEFYNQELIESVNKAYEFEINEFGYSF